MEEHNIKCHDCGNAVGQNEKRTEYDFGKKTYVKCEPCHAKDPVLRNFQATEVYSRVVGYIRPVNQWNLGKKAEYADRKEYAM